MTIEQLREARAGFTSVLATHAAVDVDVLTRSHLGDLLGFVKEAELFETIRSLVERLHMVDSEKLPLQTAGELSQSLGEIFGILQEIRDFKPEQYRNEPVRARNDLSDRLTAVYDRLAVNSAAAFSLAEKLPPDAEQLTKMMEKAYADVTTIAQRTANEATMVVQEIAKLLDVAKETAQKLGVTEHEVVFAREAQSHQRSAWIWLSISALLSVGTISFAFWTYLKALGSADAPGSSAWTVQLITSKLIIFSILLSAILASARIYRAARHNFVVNKHRQNALRTFGAFAQGASDPETKAAVLLQATHCIFSPQQTGFLTNEADASGPSPILEVIKSAGTAK